MVERATSAPVGIVGLGLMGEVYAQRLIDVKIPVTGFDIDPARRNRLAEIGGSPDVDRRTRKARRVASSSLYLIPSRSRM